MFSILFNMNISLLSSPEFAGEGLGENTHILNTPKLVAGGIPALSDAAIPSASIARVSSGSITPSSHSRALEK